MDKSKLLNMIAFILLILLTVTVLIIGFFTYKLVFPTEDETMVINYEELKPSDLITVDVKNPITSNLMTGDDGKEYFAIVEMSYEVANLKEYEEEVLELMNVLENSEVVIRRIATEEIRKRTYDDMRSSQIYDYLADDILNEVQKQFGTELICNVMIHKVTAG